jgi:hypothetical protein
MKLVSHFAVRFYGHNVYPTLLLQLENLRSEIRLEGNPGNLITGGKYASRRLPVAAKTDIDVY